jgi:hypothetical protein
MGSKWGVIDQKSHAITLPGDIGNPILNQREDTFLTRVIDHIYNHTIIILQLHRKTNGIMFGVKHFDEVGESKSS